MQRLRSVLSLRCVLLSCVTQLVLVQTALLIGVLILSELLHVYSRFYDD